MARQDHEKKNGSNSINMEYCYSFEVIRDLLKKQVGPTVAKIVKTYKLKVSIPVEFPTQWEISDQDQDRLGELGGLTHYLRQVKSLDPALPQRNRAQDHRRIIAIPYNQHGGHWIALVLRLNEKGQLASLHYIDSIQPSSQKIPQEIIKAARSVFPQFKRGYTLCYSWQAHDDRFSCGPLVVKNLLLRIEREQIRGQLCPSKKVKYKLRKRLDDLSTAHGHYKKKISFPELKALRCSHLDKLGPQHILAREQSLTSAEYRKYQAQLWRSHYRLKCPVSATQTVQDLQSLLSQFPHRDQQALRAAFCHHPKKSIRSYYQGIRATIKKWSVAIRNHDDHQNTERFDQFLRILYGHSLSDFFCQKARFSDHFVKGLEYEHLVLVGQPLKPTSFLLSGKNSAQKKRLNRGLLDGCSLTEVLDRYEACFEQAGFYRQWKYFENQRDRFAKQSAHSASLLGRFRAYFKETDKKYIAQDLVAAREALKRWLRTHRPRLALQGLSRYPQLWTSTSTDQVHAFVAWIVDQGIAALEDDQFKTSAGYLHQMLRQSVLPHQAPRKASKEKDNDAKTWIDPRQQEALVLSQQALEILSSLAAISEDLKAWQQAYAHPTVLLKSKQSQPPQEQKEEKYSDPESEQPLPDLLPQVDVAEGMLWNRSKRIKKLLHNLFWVQAPYFGSTQRDELHQLLFLLKELSTIITLLVPQSNINLSPPEPTKLKENLQRLEQSLPESPQYTHLSTVPWAVLPQVTPFYQKLSMEWEAVTTFLLKNYADHQQKSRYSVLGPKVRAIIQVLSFLLSGAKSAHHLAKLFYEMGQHAEALKELIISVAVGLGHACEAVEAAGHVGHQLSSPESSDIFFDLKRYFLQSAVQRRQRLDYWNRQVVSMYHGVFEQLAPESQQPFIEVIMAIFLAALSMPDFQPYLPPTASDQALIRTLLTIITRWDQKKVDKSDYLTEFFNPTLRMRDGQYIRALHLLQGDQLLCRHEKGFWINVRLQQQTYQTDKQQWQAVETPKAYYPAAPRLATVDEVAQFNQYRRQQMQQQVYLKIINTEKTPDIETYNREEYFNLLNCAIKAGNYYALEYLQSKQRYQLWFALEGGKIGKVSLKEKSPIVQSILQQQTKQSNMILLGQGLASSIEEIVKKEAGICLTKKYKQQKKDKALSQIAQHSLKQGDIRWIPMDTEQIQPGSLEAIEVPVFEQKKPLLMSPSQPLADHKAEPLDERLTLKEVIKNNQALTRQVKTLESSLATANERLDKTEKDLKEAKKSSEEKIFGLNEKFNILVSMLQSQGLPVDVVQSVLPQPSTTHNNAAPSSNEEEKKEEDIDVSTDHENEVESSRTASAHSQYSARLFPARSAQQSQNQSTNETPAAAQSPKK